MAREKALAKKGEFLLYNARDGAVTVDVFFQDETVWLTRKALSGLFGVKIPAINKHLKNIFETGELDKDSVISILETTAADGKNYRTQYYCLDARLHSFVKSRRTHVFVIPAKAGIQSFQIVTWDLNPGLRRGDDFLQDHET